MATKDKQADVEIHLRSDRKATESTNLPEDVQYPIILKDDPEVENLYKASEANSYLNDQLLEQDEITGEIRSQVENVVPDGDFNPEKPVMPKSERRTINTLESLIPEEERQALIEAGTMGVDFLDSMVNIIGGSAEDAAHNSLKYFYSLTPDSFQESFKQSMFGQEGGVAGITGTEEQFEQTRMFPHMGGIVEEMARSMGSFAWGMKGSGILLNTKKAMVLRGAISDMTVFNPEDGNLAHVIREMDWGPEVVQNLAAYIDSTEPGTATEKRARMAAEGILLTMAISGAIHSPQAMRELNEWRKTFFGENGTGRPAVDAVTKLLSEMKNKWNKKFNFGKYLDDHNPGWRTTGGGAPTEAESAARTPKPPKPLNTNTKKFKKWFKDSKVVDEQGKPLVVYHGTDTDFTSFRPWSHFGTAEQAGSRIERTRFLVDDSEDVLDYTDTNIIPVYLNIKNPLRLPDLGEWHYWKIASILRDRGIITDEEIQRLDALLGVDIFAKKEVMDSTEYHRQTLVTKELRKIIEDAGYDGVVYKNEYEGVMPEGKDFRDADDSYIAFHPEQIKSKFNPGTFDPTNPNIMAGGLVGSAVYNADQEPDWDTAEWDADDPPEFVKTMGGFGQFFKRFRKKPPRKPFNVHPMGGASENDQFLRKIVEKHFVEKMEFTESRSIDEILEEAKTDPRDPRKIDPKEFDDSAMIAKMKMYTLASARRLIQAMQKLEANPTPENVKAWKDAHVDLGNHLRHEADIKAGPARSMRIMSEPVEALDDPISEVVAGNFADEYIDRVMQVPEGYTPQQAVKLMLKDVRQDMEDEELLKWAEKAKDVIGWKDLFLGTMYPFMLSSLKTWGPEGANILSNINILINYPLTKFGAALTSPIRRALPIFRNDQDRITYKEAVKSLAVLRHALPEALQFAWQTFKTNQAAGGQKTKLDAPQHVSKGEDVWTSQNLREMFEDLHQNPNNKDKWFQRTILPQTVKEGGPLAVLIDSWGKLLSTSGRGLKGGDEFFKTFGRRLGQLDEAYTLAFKDLENGVIKYEEFDQALAKYLNKPTKKMMDAGETLAEFMTLQQDLGKWGKLADRLRDEGIANYGLPWGRIAIPFLKVMVNSAKHQLHMHNMTGDSFADLRGLNGGARQDMALGRYVVSAGYATTAWLLANNFWKNDGSPGVVLFGYGSQGVDMPDPENQKALREIEMNSGFRPCSLVFQDEDGGRHAYQFNKIEPLGSYMCTMADISANWEDIKGYVGDAELTKLMMTAYAVGHNNLISKSWAKSIHELLTVATDMNDRSARYFDNVVSIMIPRIVSDFRTTGIPGVISPDEHYREAQHVADGLVGAWEQIKKQIPGLSKTLPIKRNIWHEPLFNHGQWGPDHFSTFKYTRTDPDLVDKEMDRLRMPMKNVPYRIEGVKLHPRVRLRWMQLANEPRWAVDTLPLGSGKLMKGKEAVKLIIQSTTYRDATEEERVDMVSNEILARRKFAKALLFEPAGLAQIDEVIAKYQPDLLTDIEEAKTLQKNIEYPIEESQAEKEGQLAAPTNKMDIFEGLNLKVQ